MRTVRNRLSVSCRGGAESGWRGPGVQAGVTSPDPLGLLAAAVVDLPGAFGVFDIFAEIEKWLADKTKYEAVDILRTFEVPSAPVLSMKEIAEDPALRASGTVVEVDQKGRGTYLTVSSPVKFSAFQPEITGAPLLGEHTDDVLTELGYDADTIADWHRSNIVV